MVMYVCSRYRADTEEKFNEQLEWTKKIAREIMMCGHEVIVPHLMLTQFMDDNIQTEREVAMHSALRLMETCDAVFVSMKEEASEGMRAEMILAAQKNIPMFQFKTIKELREIAKMIGYRIWIKEIETFREKSKEKIEIEEKCEECLHHPKKGENYKEECGTCSHFYGSSWERR